MCNVLRRYLCIMFIVSLLNSLLITCASAENTTVSISGRFIQTDSRAMLELVNQYRTSDTWYWNSDNTTKTIVTGREPLMWSYDLEAVAMQRAIECAVFFDQTRPDGRICATALNDLGISYSYAGENIFRGLEDAEAVLEGWWGEDCPYYFAQGPRRNLLNASFNAIGIAGVEVGGIYYWVQSLACISSFGTASPANDAVTVMTVEIDADRVTGVSIESQPETITLISGENVPLPANKAIFTYQDSIHDSIIDDYVLEFDVLTGDLPDYTVSGDGLSIENGKLYAASAGTGTLTGSYLNYTFDIPVEVLSNETKRISFDANGGSDAPRSILALQSSQISIPNYNPNYPEKIFYGWAETPVADRASYYPSDTLTVSENMTLYAVWRDIEKFELAKPLTTATAEVFYDNHWISWYIIPPVTGTYTFYMTDKPGAYCALYDDDGKELKTGSLGYGRYYNISCTLEAGKQYKLKANTYNFSAACNMIINIERPFDDHSNIRLPAGTVSVGDLSFAGAGMKAVICPEGMHEIKSKAFSGCDNLTEIRIPASVTSIASDAFEGCGEFWIYTPSKSPAEAAAQTNGWNVIAE